MVLVPSILFLSGVSVTINNALSKDSSILSISPKYLNLETSFPTAYTFYQGKMLKIIESEVIDKQTNLNVGEIISTSKNGIEVATGDGVLLIKQVKPESKGVMRAFDFVNGAKIKAGDKLGE